MNFSDYIEEIKAVLFNLHNVDAATHVETVPVFEEFQGEPVWEGEVEVFDIEHPKAKRAYGWGHSAGEDDESRRYVTVLEIPPVDSPQTAVRASIVSDFKQGKLNAKS